MSAYADKTLHKNIYNINDTDAFFLTVQAICNITNFPCKKCTRIRTNFVLKFVHEIREKFVREFAHEFVHEFMPEDYVFKEKIWGKVSVSLILHEILQCRVLSAWEDI